jgi:PIF1-like helicase
LLDGGRTAHSSFYIPVDVQDLQNPPRLAYDSAEAEKIRQATAVIIDEITMLQKDSFEYIDATIRSVSPLSKRSLPFGGKIMLISGDWKQLLPVVENAQNQRIEAVAECVKQSPLYCSRRFT